METMEPNADNVVDSDTFKGYKALVELCNLATEDELREVQQEAEIISRQFYSSYDFSNFPLKRLEEITDVLLSKVSEGYSENLRDVVLEISWDCQTQLEGLMDAEQPMPKKDYEWYKILDDEKKGFSFPPDDYMVVVKRLLEQVKDYLKCRDYNGAYFGYLCLSFLL